MATRDVMRLLPKHIDAVGMLLHGAIKHRNYTLVVYIDIQEHFQRLHKHIESIVRYGKGATLKAEEVEAGTFLSDAIPTLNTIRQHLKPDSILLLLETSWKNAVDMQSLNNAPLQNIQLNDLRRQLTQIMASVQVQFKITTTSIPPDPSKRRKLSHMDVLTNPTLMLPPLSLSPPVRPELIPSDSSTVKLPPLGDTVPATSLPLPYKLQPNEIQLVNRCYNFIQGTHFWMPTEQYIPILTFTPLEVIMVVIHARSRIIMARSTPRLDVVMSPGLAALFPDTRPESMTQITQYQWKTFDDEVNAFCSRFMM